MSPFTWQSNETILFYPKLCLQNLTQPWCTEKLSLLWRPKDNRADKTKVSLGMQGQKTRPLSSFPPPCCNYKWISGPPGQYNLSPLLPHREKAFALLFPPTQYTSLIQSANDPQDPYPAPCTLGIKQAKDPCLTLVLPQAGLLF